MSTVPRASSTAWITPAAIIAVCTLVFSAGVFVGRMESAQAIARIDERLTNHAASGVHPDAVPRGEIVEGFRSINTQLGMLSGQVQDLSARVDRAFTTPD